MRKVMNEHGMTLIEIVVVLLISSILMMICGTLIINSMNSFQKTADVDIDKFKTDTLVQEVRSTLTYANNVQITDVPPSEDGEAWHSISISSDNRLLFDEQEVFPSSFYDQRELTFYAQRYENDYRVNLQFNLFDNGQSVYERSETLELINMKNRTILNDNSSRTQIIGDMKLYYQNASYSFRNDPEVPDEKPDDGFPGGLTVEDEIACMDKVVSEAGNDRTNYKGVWDAKKTYSRGQYVWYPDEKGDLYRLSWPQSDLGDAPGMTGMRWKKISKYFQTGTYYIKGDIVIYQGNYWQVRMPHANENDLPFALPWSKWAGPKNSAHELIEETKIQPNYSIGKCNEY